MEVEAAHRYEMPEGLDGDLEVDLEGDWPDKSETRRPSAEVRTAGDIRVIAYLAHQERYSSDQAACSG